MVVTDMDNTRKPNIVISKCIEHGACRYDGAMIKNSFVDKLKSLVNFITVCPEVGIGLTIPRKTLDIIAVDNQERIIITETGEDLTEKMERFADSFLNDLNKNEIDGFILKGKSPSCGLCDVKVHTSRAKEAVLLKKTSGIFAKKVLEKYPDLLIINESKLTDSTYRKILLLHI